MVLVINSEELSAGISDRRRSILGLKMSLAESFDNVDQQMVDRLLRSWKNGEARRKTNVGKGLREPTRMYKNFAAKHYKSDNSSCPLEVFKFLPPILPII